jgi:predicted GIY-YIG superfamily endonuclease
MKRLKYLNKEQKSELIDKMNQYKNIVYEITRKI